MKLEGSKAAQMVYFFEDISEMINEIFCVNRIGDSLFFHQVGEANDT